MTLDLAPFRIAPGEAAGLADRPTRISPIYEDKADYRHKLAKRVERISTLQQALYAERRRALLVILQATDAAGKDGLIRHVFSGVNPQGCQVYNFEPPSRIELAHDFLWRTTVRLPTRGCIGVFNRSYYEEVLVVRVHPDLLRGEGASDSGVPEQFWTERYRSILDHEAHLARNGTKVLKIFLHLSKEEQRRRFLARIERPDKHWKLAPADISERARWSDYQQAYAACLQATSSETVPWFAIPADDKKTARILVAAAVLEALRDLDPQYPQTPPDVMAKLDQLKAELEAEGSGKAERA